MFLSYVINAIKYVAHSVCTISIRGRIQHQLKHERHDVAFEDIYTTTTVIQHQYTPGGLVYNMRDYLLHNRGHHHLVGHHFCLCEK